MTTIPESPETLETQLEWLLSGKRQAVLLTWGVELPEIPRGLVLLNAEPGLLVYPPAAAGEVDRWQRGEIGLGDLLGYGIPDKGNAARGTGNAEPPPVVVVRGANGREKQAVVADSARLDAVTAAAHAVKDTGDTVTVENGTRVLEDRLKCLDARELKVRPLTTDGLAALDAAAEADAHCPLNPTHVIERHGEIIGYFGINSLPLYRLWFHSAKMKAGDSTRLLFMIENHYRMNGVPLVATIINTASPFYPVAARGGYVENHGDRLFLKEL